MKKLAAGMMITLVFGLTACGSSSDTASSKPADQAQSTSAGSSSLSSSTTTTGGGDAKAIMAKSSCESCHGQNLQGGAGPNLQKVGSKLSEEQIVKQIKNGSGSMPGGLIKDDKDIQTVAKYLSQQK
ncbi:c-type cytochrome [Aneurinibacillus terranovensis]|uniref:c-type cytochrome n=1 Tax=Aneurinibacillus terranovensis TaxID=278991 RepID=UPI0003FE4987|nr:cytochrome c [Aneurinibacillus terranovensis]